MVRESFAKAIVFFAKDCDRKAPRKAGKNFAKDKPFFAKDQMTERLRERRAKDSRKITLFREEWQFCLEKKMIKARHMGKLIEIG